jgi:hypothetical protein
VLKIRRGKGPTVTVHGAIQHPGAAPHPFLRPAFDSMAQATVDRYAARVGAAIEATVLELR